MFAYGFPLYSYNREMQLLSFVILCVRAFILCWLNAIGNLLEIQPREEWDKKYKYYASKFCSGIWILNFQHPILNIIVYEFCTYV